MTYWFKWAWCMFSMVLALFIKHVFKMIFVAVIIYFIMLKYYPELPNFHIVLIWFNKLDDTLKFQVAIIVTMIFGFWFQHVSNVATERQRQLIDIKVKLAERITLLTQEMCQVAITASLMCSIVDKYKNTVILDNDEYMATYFYNSYCERQRSVSNAQLLNKEFSALLNMHNTIYLQCGVYERLECILNLFRELTFVISPLQIVGDYQSDSALFVSHMKRLAIQDISYISDSSKEINVQMGAYAGGIAADLIQELHCPTFGLLKFSLFSPSSFVNILRAKGTAYPVLAHAKLREENVKLNKERMRAYIEKLKSDTEKLKDQSCGKV